jgi:hypothetical protein
MYSTPAVPVSVITVLLPVAVKSRVSGVHVELAVVALFVKVSLVPPAEARIETGGPPQRAVSLPRKKVKTYGCPIVVAIVCVTPPNGAPVW